MTILVTGASGQLGRLIVQRLLARGTAASDVIAGARTPAKATDLGVRVVELDYERSETVSAALGGVDRVVLVSSSEVGERAAQHAVVIEAAKDAGVELLVYTSLFNAPVSTHVLAPEHVETEQLIEASGIPAAILRNNWYNENQLNAVAPAAQTGEIAASTADGRIASAARLDYADAAAVVVTGADQAGKVYELAGDVSWNYADLAHAASEILGRDISFRRLTPQEHQTALESAGLDAGLAGFLVAMDAGTAAGQLHTDDRTLADLIGRPTTPLVESFRAS
ncbi:SDR family oxidoreductase [Microbacterium lacticum]